MKIVSADKVQGISQTPPRDRCLQQSYKQCLQGH